MEIKSWSKWTEGMAFTGSSGRHEVSMDASSPIGKGGGFTPKELITVGLAGCTAMDVIALMKKYRQPVESFEVKSEATPTEGVHPLVFKEVRLKFILKGALDKERVIEAVRLSQTKYCGVSQMLSKAAPIRYKIELNGEEIGGGEASFV